jgi:hypothetical protein
MGGGHGLTEEGKERRAGGRGLGGGAARGGAPREGGLQGEAPWGCSVLYVADVS